MAKEVYFAISPSCDMDGPYETIESAKLAAKELLEDDRQTIYIVRVEYSVSFGEIKFTKGYKE